MTQKEMEAYLQEKGLPNETNWIYGVPCPLSPLEWWYFHKEVKWIQTDIQETGYYAFMTFPEPLNAADRNALVPVSNPTSRAGIKE